MNIKKTEMFAVACLSLALSATASAAPGNAWTGLYVGGQLGYGWAEDETKNYSVNDPSYSDWIGEHDMDGATGGIFAGYNFQNGNWVYGVEFDAERSNIEGGDTSWSYGDEINAEITSQVSARARLGYAYNRALIYATGGLAIANIDTRYTNDGNVDRYDHTRSGWTLGAGVDYAFGPNWMGRIEYRYADFGRVKDDTTTADPGYAMKNDITEQVVRIGIGYKF